MTAVRDVRSEPTARCGLTLGAVLEATAERFPERPAASLGRRSLTFAELAALAGRLADRLAARGVARGARVAWLGPTSLEAVGLFFACARLGAAFVPVDSRLPEDETRTVLDLADPAVVVGEGTGAADVALRELAAEPPQAVPHHGLRRGAGRGQALEVSEDDPLVVFFTSGSTGRPKGVVLTHRTQWLRSVLDASPHPVGATVSMFPLAHMAGWQLACSAWLSGDQVVLVPGADGEALLEAVERHRAARLYAIPAVWRRILEADRRGRDLSSLRAADTGTSRTTPELLAAIRDAFPAARTTVTYGSTEAGLVCRLGPDDVLRKPGSVGTPGPSVRVRLAEDGELLVSSPYLASGYLSDPHATRLAFDGGWFRTGDLAQRDDEGYLTIVGRVADLVRTGGETVVPARVEQVVETHPNVREAAVAGTPDDEWGEVVTAFVVPRPGASLTLEELRRHCAGRLASYEVPRRLVVVDALPRTGATGQVRRRELAALAESEAPR